MPKKLPKRGVNRQFQAKTPKSIHRNISGTINPTNKRFENRVQTSWYQIEKKLGALCYSPSIGTMAVSLTVYEIFSVKA